MSLPSKTQYTLDIGGEGRHRDAWNLNPSRLKTTGNGRGEPIPQLVLGRAEAIPLPDSSVDCVIVERTPLRRQALEEIKRVMKPRGKIVLRHAVAHGFDPHRLAVQILPGRSRRKMIVIGGRPMQETLFLIDQPS